MPCPKDVKRVDANGRAHAGSQKQIQTYVNDNEAELNDAIANALLAYSLDKTRIQWVSPLRGENYAEYQDQEFLEKIGAPLFAKDVQGFWPHRGPCWDALARLDDDGCILVEAKSHTSEVRGNGCGASGDSLSIIKSSLAQTKAWLGVKPDADWLGSLYQSANRL